MNIKQFKQKQQSGLVSLSEAHQPSTPVVNTPQFEAGSIEQKRFEQQQQFKQVREVFIVDSNKFKFENGSFMARISVPIKSKFGLYYHYNLSNDFESFVTSIKNYLARTGTKLTDNDIKRLEVEYSKASKR